MEKGISQYMSDLSLSRESYLPLASPTPVALSCHLGCLLLCHLSFSEHYNCCPYGNSNLLTAFFFLLMAQHTPMRSHEDKDSLLHMTLWNTLISHYNKWLRQTILPVSSGGEKKAAAEFLLGDDWNKGAWESFYLLKVKTMLVVNSIEEFKALSVSL